jgi:hypothetical protein
MSNATVQVTALAGLRAKNLDVMCAYDAPFVLLEPLDLIGNPSGQHNVIACVESDVLALTLS